MQTATINVRLSQELKTSSDAVLRRENISVSDLVRKLMEFISSEQRLPDFLDDDQAESLIKTTKKKRAALESIRGILGDEIVDMSGIKAKRLDRQVRTEAKG